MPRYRAYLSDVSYFSGKLEGALRAKRIAYERVTITPGILLNEVMPNTGWMKVPALRREDGLWLADTTPLLRWLDAAHPQRPLIPEDPYRAFLSALIEDGCDEWQWRPAMFWRWAWPDNARYLGARLGAELSRDSWQPAWSVGLYFRRRQQRIYLREDGVTHANFDAIAALYPRALGWLDALLKTRPFLLGERPSLVDIAWFGPMFRHYAQDPRPAALMAAQAPRVWQWVTRVWNSGEREWRDTPLDDFSDPAWDAMFADIGNAYLPYLRDNARALRDGTRHFSGRYGEIHYSRLPAIRYRARCLRTLQDAYAALSPDVRVRVDARLQPFGITDSLRARELGDAFTPIDSAIAKPIAPLTLAQRLRFYFAGTPWEPAA